NTMIISDVFFFFFSSRRRHTRWPRDWSSDVCSSDLSWVKCKDDGALPNDIEKAKALIKDYGKPVEFKMLVTATPRGRAVGQVLQQFWKQVGANMEIEQVDQATIDRKSTRLNSSHVAI